MIKGICTHCKKSILIYEDTKLCESCDIIERDMNYIDSIEEEWNDFFDDSMEII